MAKQKDTGGCGTCFILFAVLCAIGQFIEENYTTICIILGIIAFIILFCIFFKHKKKKENTSSQPDIKQTDIPLDNYLIPDPSPSDRAASLLKKAHHLADVLNTTIDRKEFYTSFDELNSTLKSLSELEGIVDFSGKLPSVNLMEINAKKQASIDFLERRIKEAETQISDNSDFTLEATQKYPSKEDTEIQSQNNLNIESTPKFKNKLEVDRYFVEAGKFIIEKNRVSIGMLQRLFKIGFNRAAGIIDQLGDVGVVGPEDGVKPRKVLMSMEQFEDFLKTVELIDSISSETTVSDSNLSFSTFSNTVDDRIRMYNGKYDYMEGHDFEQFCAKLLKANGFSNVYVTPGSNDQGIDILAEKLGVKYAIQCKRYSSDVGNKAVQEVFAGKSYYNCHVGVVLTNRYFTQSAKELAEKTQVFLWNRDILNALCENYYKENPSENK